MSLQDRIENTASQPETGGLQFVLPNVQLPGLEVRNSLEFVLMATAREPLAILNSSLQVMAANPSYCRLFPVKFSTLLGQPFCEPSALLLGMPVLNVLKDVLAGNGIVENLAFELDVPGAGHRRLVLSARPVSDRSYPAAAILVGLEDVSERFEAERLKLELANQQEVLLQEAHHRIANSLQIIASILLLKARSVSSEETRAHLRDVHKRLILVATVQRQLCSAGMLEEIEFGPYVAQLCQGLARSMTEGAEAVKIVTTSTAGMIKSDAAISFGLIVTERVLNALKHGFPDGRGGTIKVDFAAEGADWRLTVSDDGVGRKLDGDPNHTGLGTNIVEALARHLKAKVEVAEGGVGSSTAIVHVEQTVRPGDT